MIVLTIPRALLLGAAGGATIMWLAFYLFGETPQQADERAATALCTTSTSNPGLIPDCVKAALPTIQFNRRMNQAKQS
jgi:hypothetical protein